MSTRVCAHCALSLCSQCLANFDPVTGAAQCCHVPEPCRAICPACASQHRILAIPITRVLTHSAVASSTGAAGPSGDAMVDVEPPASPHPFGNYYDRLDGAARCFELFDAHNVSVWATPLPFDSIYIFASEVLAAHYAATNPAVRAYPFLSSPSASQMCVCRPAHCLNPCGSIFHGSR